MSKILEIWSSWWIPCCSSTLWPCGVRSSSNPPSLGSPRVWQGMSLPCVLEEAMIGLHDQKRLRKLRTTDVQPESGCCHSNWWAAKCSAMKSLNKKPTEYLFYTQTGYQQILSDVIEPTEPPLKLIVGFHHPTTVHSHHMGSLLENLSICSQYLCPVALVAPYPLK